MSGWVSWAQRDPIANRAGGPTSGNARKITIHTTETSGKPGWGANPNVPHFTLNPATGQAWQHIDCHRSGYALASPGAPTSPNMNAGIVHIQLEVIGYAGKVPFYSQAWYDQLGKWLSLLGEQFDVPMVFPFPFTGSNGYGRSGVVRQSWSAYANASGIVGHSHAPYNDHWDPGDLALSRLKLSPPPPNNPEEPAVGREYVAYKSVGSRTIPRGKEVVLAEVDATEAKGQAILWNAQFAFSSGRGPLRAKKARVRFVRVPKNDGTGELRCNVTPGVWADVHNHVTMGGTKMQVRVTFPGKGGNVKLRYLHFKAVRFA